MRGTFLKALFVLAVCVIVVGFFRGWFTFSTSRDAADDKVHINLTVDQQKVKEDAGALKQLPNKAEDEAKKIRDNARN